MKGDFKISSWQGCSIMYIKRKRLDLIKPHKEEIAEAYHFIIHTQCFSAFYRTKKAFRRDLIFS